MVERDVTWKLEKAKNNLEFIERLTELVRFDELLEERMLESMPLLSYWYERSEEEVRKIVFMRFPGSIEGSDLSSGREVYKEAEGLTARALKWAKEHEGTEEGKRTSRAIDIFWLEPTVALKVRLYDYVSRVNYGESIHVLYKKAESGDLKSLWRLVRVDKTVLLNEWAGEVIKRKQYEGDWEFFRKLGRAISQEPVKPVPNLMKVALLAEHFWGEYFKHMSYEEMRKLFYEQGLIGKDMDQFALQKFLNRQGLKKYSRG